MHLLSLQWLPQRSFDGHLGYRLPIRVSAISRWRFPPWFRIIALSYESLQNSVRSMHDAETVRNDINILLHLLDSGRRRYVVRRLARSNSSAEIFRGVRNNTCYDIDWQFAEATARRARRCQLLLGSVA
jgi:hypothetical protein